MTEVNTFTFLLFFYYFCLTSSTRCSCLSCIISNNVSLSLIRQLSIFAPPISCRLNAFLFVQLFSRPLSVFHWRIEIFVCFYFLYELLLRLHFSFCLSSPSRSPFDRQAHYILPTPFPVFHIIFKPVPVDLCMSFFNHSIKCKVIIFHR